MGSDSTQFTVSYEAIAFMKWLLTNKKSLLDNLVEQALADNLRQDILDFESKPSEFSNKQLYKIVTEFLHHLEDKIQVRLDQKEAHQWTEQIKTKHLPNFNFLGLESFDDDSVMLSALQAENEINSGENKKRGLTKKELLAEALLDNWYPDTDPEEH